jgi:hypothetical protein
MHKIILLIVLSFLSCSTSKKTVDIEENVIENKELTDTERIFLIQTLKASLHKFDEATQSLSEEQLYFKVKLNKWSIAECIEHVTLAELHFSDIVEEEMKKPANPDLRAKIKIKDEKIRPKMLSRIWKAKSPEVFKPSGKFKNPKEAIIAFREQRLKTIEYIKTTNDDLRNHFWYHRLTKDIDLYQTIILMSAHLERHIEQIENIKKEKEFPL